MNATLKSENQRTIYIVRHGAYSGSNLTERGKHSIAEAAETIAQDLKGKKVVVVASDVTRAIESAEIIANKLGAKVDSGYDFLYEGSKMDLRQYLQGNESEAIVFVGHEPFMNRLGFDMGTGQVRKLNAQLNEKSLERVALEYKTQPVQKPVEKPEVRKARKRNEWKERLEDLANNNMLRTFVEDCRDGVAAIANVGMIASWVAGAGASFAAGYTGNPMYATAAVVSPAAMGTLGFAGQRANTITSIDPALESAAECGKATAANYGVNALLFGIGWAARRFG